MEGSDKSSLTRYTVPVAGGLACLFLIYWAIFGTKTLKYLIA
jgi:hypothetical protein